MTELRDDREAGFSLVEMLVAMLIFSVLMTAVLGVTTAFFGTEGQTTQRFNNLGDAQTAMDVLTQDIRTATAVNGTTVAVAQSTQLSFYAGLGAATGPTLVTFALTGTGLSMTTTPGPGYSSTSQSISLLSGHIVSPTSGSGALFTYYGSAGSLTTNPAAVASVSIDLVDNGGPANQTSATLQSQIWLRSVEYANS